MHGLITQPSLKEQVVRERHKTGNFVLKGVEFQLIYHNPKHFFGGKKWWIDSYNKVSCSDLEKIMIDCLYMLGYAGGIVEAAKALWISMEKLDYDKLLKYAKQFEQPSGDETYGISAGQIGDTNEYHRAVARFAQCYGFSTGYGDPQCGEDLYEMEYPTDC